MGVLKKNLKKKVSGDLVVMRVKGVSSPFTFCSEAHEAIFSFRIKFIFVALLRAAVDSELELVQTHSLSLPPPSSTSSPTLQIMIRTVMIMMIKMMTMIAMMIKSTISPSAFPHLATLLERTKIREYGPP